MVKLGYHYHAINTFCKQEQHSAFSSGVDSFYVPSAYRRALASGLQGRLAAHPHALTHACSPGGVHGSCCPGWRAVMWLAL